MRTDQTGAVFTFLFWNLFLAWIPFLLALAMTGLDRLRAPGWLLAPVSVVWLLFLPNAPYILTDFIHLGAVAGVLAAPPEDAPYGQVVRQAPAAGELFYDRMIYGLSCPAWDWFPPGVGWLALGTMIAAFTVAALAYLDPSADLHVD